MNDRQIQILAVQGELDLVTADSLYVRAWAAIHRPARLLLLDLTGMSFCDAQGLGALVRIANDADAAGCRYGLIAPRPNVAAVLRITGLDNRLPVFAAMDQICTGRDQEHFAGNPPLAVDDVVLPGSRTNLDETVTEGEAFTPPPNSHESPAACCTLRLNAM